MTTWTERMHQRAATFGNVVTSCGHPSTVPYPRRLEKVKFGVPLEEVCKNDIPGPLLVLILKLNKEAPFKKDVFRAPGHQGNMKKLIHFLQNGRLVNMDNFSVYTIASVLKKFLRKLPGGIFGADGERCLFDIIEMKDKDAQREKIHQLITSLPEQTQRLLVLLFGTFRVIATQANRANTGMSSEALGVSVAPSFFQSCVSDGKQARMEDVLRYKVATRIMKFLIDNFGASNLFGRQNYEFYARITGRILKVEEDWIFSFRYPPNTMVSPISQQEESQSTPALIHIPEASSLGPSVSSLGIIPENNLLQSYTRLSISLEENGLFKKSVNRNADEDTGAVVVVIEESSSRSSTSSTTSHHLTLEELRAINRYAESTKSLSFLPQVHERQAARMRTRSEWFLSPAQQELLKESASSRILKVGSDRSSSDNIVLTSGLSVSAESVKTLLRRTSSRDKERVRRGSARKNKENGKKQQSITEDQQHEHQSSRSLSEDHDEGNMHITYKPRI
ncbi:rho GTPase-activating protein 20 [Neocloeon triangulifer]|uniref:rho GTPase-activating protein 20 n=1 Tax=Neocloeon triangulifer TaxID=2078957 RepID=UPI00286F1308|nr:rho GTPase-activating protein 20 [Neocloeon triangulifer]